MSHEAAQALSVDPLMDMSFQMVELEHVISSATCGNTTHCDYGATVDSIFADQTTNTPSNTLLIMMGFEFDTYVASIATKYPTYKFV